MTQVRHLPNWGQVVVDETTGLPEVPEGYFWRIDKGDFDGSSHAKIRLMREAEPQKVEIPAKTKYTFFRGTVVIEPARIEMQNVELEVRSHPIAKIVLNRDTAFENAAYILWVLRKEGWTPGDENPTALYGDYPPKSIKPQEA